MAKKYSITKNYIGNKKLFLNLLEDNKDLKENFVKKYDSNKYTSHIILSVNGCTINANYSSWSDDLHANIHHHKNSKKKIHEAKSFLEEKTDWDFKEMTI